VKDSGNKLSALNAQHSMLKSKDSRLRARLPSPLNYDVTSRRAREDKGQGQRSEVGIAENGKRKSEMRKN